MTEVRIPYSNNKVFSSEQFLRPATYVWMIEYVGKEQWGEYRYTGDNYLGGRMAVGVAFTFKDPRKATLFKLTWA